MSYEQFKATLGPSVAELDAELRDESDSMLKRYAEQFDPAQIGARSWQATPTAQKRAMRAQNELARRQREKEQAEAKAAEDKRIEDQRNAANQARIDAYKAQARGAWIGDQASFDAAWPRLLEDWRIDQARAQVDANMAAVRARIGNAF